jgi:hypothetical protein
LLDSIVNSLGELSSVWRTPYPSLISISNGPVSLLDQQLSPSQPANMSNDVSPDQMQARIQQARREAETLKDRIKRKKDELADGTREYPTI